MPFSADIPLVPPSVPPSGRRSVFERRRRTPPGIRRSCRARFSRQFLGQRLRSLSRQAPPYRPHSHPPEKLAWNVVCSSASLRTPCRSKSPRSYGRVGEMPSQWNSVDKHGVFRSGVFHFRVSDAFSTGLRPTFREVGGFFGRRARLRVFRGPPPLDSERSPRPCRIIRSGAPQPGFFRLCRIYLVGLGWIHGILVLAFFEELGDRVVGASSILSADFAYLADEVCRAQDGGAEPSPLTTHVAPLGQSMDSRLHALGDDRILRTVDNKRQRAVIVEADGGRFRLDARRVCRCV